MQQAVLAFCVLALTSSTVWGLFGNHTACVKGRLTCPSKPEDANNMEVKLVHSLVGPDTTMKKVNTDANGKFEVCGSAKSLYGKPNVRVKLYTQCNKGWSLRCIREIIVNVPEQYVDGTWDLGTFNMELQYKNEDHPCFHT